MTGRATPTGIHFATANVNGNNGLLIFPDDWDGSFDITNPDNYSSDFGTNTFASADWVNLEAKGIVFLPAAGYRVNGDQIVYVQTGGIYWASTASSENLAYSMYFVVEDKHRSVNVNYREFGASVRLVKDDTLVR